MGHYGKFQNVIEMVPYIISIIIVLALAVLGANAPGTQESLAQAPPYTLFGILFIVLVIWILNKIGEKQRLQTSPTSEVQG